MYHYYIMYHNMRLPIYVCTSQPPFPSCGAAFDNSHSNKLPQLQPATATKLQQQSYSNQLQQQSYTNQLQQQRCSDKATATSCINQLQQPAAAT